MVHIKLRLLVLLLLSLALKTQFRVPGACKDTPGDVHSGVVTLSSVDGLCHSGYVGGVHLASPKVERINFYDDYNFLDGPSFKEYTNVNLMRKKNAQNATGHPTGSVTLTTGGERLYGVTYYTAKGLPRDTHQSCTDGKLDRALFDGGFCLLSGQPAAYCYYVCDHLGSVREVVSEAWDVQRNGCYAYGGPYGDWNPNVDVQPLKFLGKEWNHQHGLDLYDFGARLYDPAVGRWTTMDPLCEKYYSVSPYAYCHNNPANRIDPDGRDDYYSVGGQFLFRESKKTDRIIIRDLVTYSTKQKGWEFGPNPDTPIEQTVLSAEAYSKIFTNILSEMKDVDIYLLHNQGVSVVVSPNDYDIESTFNDPYSAFAKEGVVNAATQHLNGVKKITACINYLGASDNRKLFATLSNVQNLLGVHEYIGHGVKGWSGSNHKLAYKNQFKHPSWKRTTGYFKRQELSNYQKEK